MAARVVGLDRYKVLGTNSELSLWHLMVTLGMGWKPSSEAGRAGDPVQK